MRTWHDLRVQPSPSELLPYADARRLARTNAWREKALVYVTRQAELLVLEHTGEYLDAGVQVPAGGVEPGEEPSTAAVRELFEETGLRSAAPAIYLESHLWTTEDAPSRIRHYYWVSVPSETPDAWSHLVSAGDEDRGMTFRLRFRPLTDPQLTLGYGWESALTRLTAIRTSQPGAPPGRL